MIRLEKDLKKIWITSDTHYHHRNICRGVSRWGSRDEQGIFRVSEEATRDFSDLREMDEALVDRINSRVQPEDVMIHVGDWSFAGQERVKEFRDLIRCKNIILIYGNHDGHIRSNSMGEKRLFRHVSDYEEMKVNNEHKLVLFHYPIESWNGMREGAIMLQGHQHLKGDKRFANGKRMDIGACGNDLWPYSLEEIVDLMRNRQYVPENSQEQSSSDI
jgi:calcineurin-like phosphoesterase family protein